MQDYEGFSHIIEAVDPLFNEIWDGNTSVLEEETKTESRIVVSVSDSEAGSVAKKDVDSRKGTQIYEVIPLKDTPVQKRLAATPTSHPKREKVTISVINADNQSIISTISKSTFHTSSTIDMASVLVESPLDREVSEITTTMRVKPMKPEENESVENGGIFINLYESMIAEQALNMSRCINKDTVVENNDVLKEPSRGEENIFEGLEKDETPFISNDDTIHAKHESVPPEATHRPFPINTFFSDSEPIVSLPDFLASTAPRFSSRSLSVDDISKVSIYADEKDEDDGPNNNSTHKVAVSSKKAGTEVATATATAEVPAVTLEEKRLDERNLLDSLSPEERQDKTVAPQEESPTEEKAGDILEEENVTEGLGLILPPHLSLTPQTIKTDDPLKTTGETSPEKMERKSQESQPETIQVEPQQAHSGKIQADTQETNSGKIQADTQETHPGKIEVDEAGQILIDDEVDSTESISNHDSPRHYGEAPSSPRDVYISYRIESDSESEPDDTTTGSNTSVRTPTKQISGLKSRLMPRWKMKMKMKFSTGNKEKKNGRRKSRTKNIKSVYDSPARTVETATTATTASTATTTAYANMAFASEFPVSRGSLPNFIRPKTKS